METNKEELVKLMETIAIQALHVEIWRTGAPPNRDTQVNFSKAATVGIKENADQALLMVRGM
tara:strand:- start:1179 stop:1364 length:186 start_codon:yes stop_codon:yes gene_type:complete